MIENQRNERCNTEVERFFPELWRDATPPSRMVGVVNNDKRELTGKAQSYKAAPRKYVRTDKDKCPGSDGRKNYGRLHDLGAHAILSLNIGLPGKVLFLLFRDCSLSGFSAHCPSSVADELDCDVDYVRRILKGLEEESYITKVKTRTGSSYLINPRYYSVGTNDQEEMARQSWVKANKRRR